MSHFTCLAIGELEEIMAPYCEHDSEYFTRNAENTDEYNEDYQQVMDGTKEKAHDEFFERYPESERTIGNFINWWSGYTPCYTEDQINDCIESKHSCAVIKDNVITEMYYFSNPNAKWDYYQESSARWDYDIILKDGSCVSEGRVGDIDIDAMMERARKDRAETFDEVRKYVKKPVIHTPFKVYAAAWDNGETTRDGARELYNKQPIVKKIRAYGKKVGWYLINPDDFLIGRKEYIDNASLPFFCANILGDWSERGEMGWWACVSNEKKPTDWRDEIYNKLKDAIENHPDEHFTFIDCHI